MAAVFSTAATTRLLSSTEPLAFSSTSHKTLSSSSLLPLKLRNPFHPKPLKFSPTKISAIISVGDTLPESTFSYFDPAGELKTTTVSELTKGKKTVLFGVPGAFTPICSFHHLPSFADLALKLKAKGIDTIACISVNDVFVMKAWRADVAKEWKGVDEVMLLSDCNANFTTAIGCEIDLIDNPVGFGVRSRRYSMLVEDGVIKLLYLERGGLYKYSSADYLLTVLG
ncbi:hypothetical protein LguiA_032404 [Lonicera macranthoides]